MNGAAKIFLRIALPQFECAHGGLIKKADAESGKDHLAATGGFFVNDLRVRRRVGLVGNCERFFRRGRFQDLGAGGAFRDI